MLALIFSSALSLMPLMVASMSMDTSMQGDMNEKRTLMRTEMKSSESVRTETLDNGLPIGAISHPKDALKLDACKPGGKWPNLEKFDLVISWWTGTHQSNYTKSEEFVKNDKMKQKNDAAIDNQAEIMYSLRSYEKNGMLDHVNQVFVMIDRDVLATFGAPRFFDYNGKNIKVVSSEDLGLEAGGQWQKLTRMHTIPGLSDYFLWLPDDNFMMHKFDLSALWSEDQQKPKLHEFGTWRAGVTGWCDDGKATGALHGPVLIQKCAMAAVMDRYLGSVNQATVIRNAMANNTPIDTLCLFTRAMANSWQNDGFDTHFQEECHTNGGCNPNSQALFMNIQGFEVSDEYPQGEMSPAAKELMPNGAAKFFESQYPVPSRFEKPGGAGP